MTVNIEDLLPPQIKVEVSEGKFLELQPLSLEEMCELLVNNQELFLTLYAQVSTNESVEKKIGLLLLSAPEFVAKIIAMAAKAVGQEKAIRRLPPTVQLIALHELWKASVPDPKKAGELLSEVMGQLRQLSQKGKPVPVASNSMTTPSSSGTESQPS